MAREWVWLQCTDCSDLNYRITIDPKETDTKKLISSSVRERGNIWTIKSRRASEESTHRFIVSSRPADNGTIPA